jgi:ribosomal protein S13
MENVILLLKKRILKTSSYYNKNSFFLIRKIYGLGFLRSLLFLIYTGSNKNFNLKGSFLIKLTYLLLLQRLLFKTNWLLETALRSFNRNIFSINKVLKTYKFFRINFLLPLRGQRTHSNRQTVKKNVKYF